MVICRIRLDYVGMDGKIYNTIRTYRFNTMMEKECFIIGLGIGMRSIYYNFEEVNIEEEKS